MIFKNGTQWEGWKTDLAKRLKNTKGNIRNARFEVTERYSGYRNIKKSGSEGFQWVKTYAESVGIPPEFKWTDENGERCIIRYVERTDVRVENGRAIQIEYPGEIYIEKGKFDINKSNYKELFWFYMASEYCENGFDFDTSWGLDLKTVEMNRMLRVEQPRYKYVDDSAVRKSDLEREGLIFKALEAIERMPEKEMRMVYAAVLKEHNSDTEEMDTIKLMLIAKAKKEPDDIIKADVDEITYQSVVNRAEENHVINYNRQGRAWLFTGESQAEPICLVPKGKNPSVYLVEFLRTKDNAGEVFKAIKAGLKENDAEAKAEAVVA